MQEKLLALASFPLHFLAAHRNADVSEHIDFDDGAFLFGSLSARHERVYTGNRFRLDAVLARVAQYRLENILRRVHGHHAHTVIFAVTQNIAHKRLHVLEFALDKETVGREPHAEKPYKRLMFRRIDCLRGGFVSSVGVARTEQRVRVRLQHHFDVLRSAFARVLQIYLREIFRVRNLSRRRFRVATDVYRKEFFEIILFGDERICFVAVVFDFFGFAVIRRHKRFYAIEHVRIRKKIVRYREIQRFFEKLGGFFDVALEIIHRYHAKRYHVPGTNGFYFTRRVHRLTVVAHVIIIQFEIFVKLEVPEMFVRPGSRERLLESGDGDVRIMQKIGQ